MAETKKKKPTTTKRGGTGTTRKKSTSRKKKATPPTTSEWLQARWPELTGLILIVADLFAVFQMGPVGKWLANLARWGVGDHYGLFLVILLLPLSVLLAYGHWPQRVRTSQYVGLGLLAAGFLLINSTMFAGTLNHQLNLGEIVSLNIAQDMRNESVMTPVGGGMTGALLYQMIGRALGTVGAWMLGILAMLSGLIVMFSIPVKDVFENVFDLAEGTGDYVQVQATQVHENVTERVAAFRERQSASMAGIFADDPFEPMQKQKQAEPESDAAPAPVAPATPMQPDAPQPPVAAEPGFVMPEIVAPPAPPVKNVSPVLPDEPIAAPTPEQQQPFGPLDGLAEPTPFETLGDPDFDPEQVVQAEDAQIEPVVYGDDISEADLMANEVPLTHADILGHSDAATSPKTKAHQTNVGHVEPSTQSEPTPDVDASGLAQTIDDAHYRLPTTALLTEIGSTDQSAERDALNEKALILHETLKSFNINATVEKVVLGPTVTQYEIKPAVGVKVSKIQNLADDLALSLAAKSLRIEAPIPGKNVVGIEVANDQQATVGFRDMVEEAGIDTERPLVVPIGRGVTSGVMKMDLTKMPHLLIAGSTGSGKSVAINGILASILLQAKPSQVRLMLVDPKKVELSVYNDIPHLITPVVSDPKKAALGLKKVVAEMERRFKLFTEEGVRNLDGYNRLIEKRNQQDPSYRQQKMPYLVVIIDELADLMMTSTVSGDVETSIVRIAQLGRAAGLHMIVATQRPSVDIITGLIKANVPSRMAFAVSSGVDSRTILDGNGAEKLLGRGDMLFSPIGSNGPQRVQGAFLTDEDVENLTDFIKQQGDAQYDQTMTVSDADVQSFEKGGDGDGNELDELWDDVLVFVLRAGGASTSSIQRHFKIGYNRAGRMVDDMADRGLISGPNGSKPRTIHFTAEQLPHLKRSDQV